MHIISAVEALGKQMGVPLKLNDDGCASLNVGDQGSLFIERSQDTMAVSFARKLDMDVLPCLERGLELCRLKNEPRLGLRVGLFRNDTIVVVCKLEKHHINAGMTGQILPYLFETMEKII